MRKIRSVALVLGLCLLLPSRAFAWHRSGHMAIAWFAWQQLDDREKSAAIKILQEHPHYALYLTADRPAELEEGQWAFLRAAIWPDWVRDPVAPWLDSERRRAIKKDFDRPRSHYVNLPYIHPDEPDLFDAAAIRKQVLTPPFDETGNPRHVLAALKQAREQLAAAGTPAAQKAVSLCWLSHLVGDIHQPLHATEIGRAHV